MQLHRQRLFVRLDMRGFFFLCVLAGAAGAFAQGPAEAIDGPAVKVGDVWIFNKLNGWNKELEDVSVVSVKRITADGIDMEAASLDGKVVAKILRTRGFNLVRIEAPGFTQTALPYYPNFAFPLQVGKTWRSAVSLANTSQPDKTVQADLEGRVAGYESVTVPAGTFFALRIELKGWYKGKNSDGQWTGTIEDTLWYSPAVRNAVRYEYKDTVGASSRHNHEIHELLRYWLVP
jgi:hypothetical protein